MQDRRKPVLTHAEVVPDKAVRAAADRHGADTLIKVRVADALEINDSGIANDLFRYALQAHFDFLVVETERRLPQFAVEFDDASHSRPQVVERDRKKNEICQRLGLPLLRIDSRFLRAAREGTVVGWLIDIWFLEREFHAMQDRGEIPPDEPFMYFAAFEPQPGGALRSLALDSEARSLLQGLHREGVGLSYVPEEVKAPFGREGDVESYAVWAVDAERFFIGHARLRSFGYFGLPARELVSDLAVVDLGERVRRYRADRLHPSGLNQLGAMRERTRGWESVGGFVAPGPLKPWSPTSGRSSPR